jgi:hypothetical protein
MQTAIDTINKELEPIKQTIVSHPTYEHITTIEGVRAFMEQHIFAVWDFMSLLKALQNHLTCTTVPWFPVGNAKTRFLINEIVCGEESDVAYQADGNTSHFELYLEAMQQANASTAAIDQFISDLKAGKSVVAAISPLSIPEKTKDFVRFTFEVIATNKPHIIAAVFTFGREDLIPSMFRNIVDELNTQFKGQLDIFAYYLDRHIEVDGDHHSHLALEMVSILCGEDEKKWLEAQSYSLRAMEMRNALWNGVMESLTVKA